MLCVSLSPAIAGEALAMARTAMMRRSGGFIREFGWFWDLVTFFADCRALWGTKNYTQSQYGRSVKKCQGEFRGKTKGNRTGYGPIRKMAG